MAHLIRKAPSLTGRLRLIAISGAVEQKAAQIGQWILTDLKDLIAAIADNGPNSQSLIGAIKRRLSRVCHLGKKAEHSKLQALAKEIRLGLGRCGCFCPPSRITADQ